MNSRYKYIVKQLNWTFPVNLTFRSPWYQSLTGSWNTQNYKTRCPRHGTEHDGQANGRARGSWSSKTPLQLEHTMVGGWCLSMCISRLSSLSNTSPHSGQSIPSLVITSSQTSLIGYGCRATAWRLPQAFRGEWRRGLHLGHQLGFSMLHLLVLPQPPFQRSLCIHNAHRRMRCQQPLRSPQWKGLASSCWGIPFSSALRGFPSFLAQVQLPARARALLLVSKEKEKLVPMFREKWKVLPWVASALDSMHFE